MSLVFVGAVAQFPRPVKEHGLSQRITSLPLFRPAWMRFRSSMFWMYSSKNNVRSSFPISR